MMRVVRWSVVPLLALLVVVAAQAAGSIPVDGCVVIELTQPGSWPDNAAGKQGWNSGDAELDRWLKELGATSLKQEYGTLLPSYRVLRFPSSISTDDVLAVLQERSDVANAWGNVAFEQSELRYTPDDPLLPSQWHLQAINAERGFALSGGSEEIVVGIVDGGVNWSHPDLATSMWINPGEDLDGDGIWNPSVDEDGIDNDENGYTDDGIGWDWVATDEGSVFPGEDAAPPDNNPDDFNGHGTHCAGDAGATTGNGIGVASPGAGCRVAALRAGWTLTTGQGVVGLSEATSAIAYAVEHDFSVISMSFGGSGGDPQYFYQGMEAATDSGLVLVAAAGNESSTSPHYPAAEPFVISVASTNPNNELSGFSNSGTWITVSAPGSFIYSTLNSGGYGAMSGTSMACPVTAGAIASLLSLAPDWTYDEVTTRIALTSTPMSQEGTGAGLLNLGALLDPFVSVDSVGVASASGPRLTHDQPATLSLRIAKLDGFVSGINVDLQSDNPRVLLDADTLQVAFLGGGSSVVRDVGIEVEGNGSSREEIRLDLRFTGEDAIGGVFDYTQPIYLQVGVGDVLFVDADMGGEGRLDLWYTAPLNELGLAVDVVTLDEVNDLDTRLEPYQTAILATGSRLISPFNEGQIDAWANFVRQGGNWLVSGQNIAESVDGVAPMAMDTLFQVDFTREHANRLTAKGIDGVPLTQNVNFVLAGEGGAWNQTSLDVIAAQEGAEPLFVYTHDVPEELAGVRVAHGAGEIVFCSFGLEAVNDSIATGTHRADWFRRLFTAWGVEVGVEDEAGELSAPSTFALHSAYPNPTNGMVTIPFTLPQAQRVKVVVVDLLGREVASWQQRAHAGSNRISWQMPGHLASGVYLLNLKAGTQTATTKVAFVK
ncbi:S8 family peptidase [bacterium]|nr:S8 family peptidase [bacterium]